MVSQYPKGGVRVVRHRGMMRHERRSVRLDGESIGLLGRDLILPASYCTLERVCISVVHQEAQLVEDPLARGAEQSS